MAQLRHRDPFRDLVSLREAMDQPFEESVVRPRMAAVTPRTLAVDMYETDEAVVVKTAVPGADPEDIDISITGDTLTIQGEIKAEEEIEEADCVCRERPSGAFSRSLTIPVWVEAGEAEAEFEDGILTLTLPKSEELKPKAIKVKSR
jgi:HSP20 family protein